MDDDDLDQELEALRERILGEQYGTPYCFLCGVDCGQLAVVKNLGFGFFRVQSSTNVLDVSTPEDEEASEEGIIARMLERPKRPGVSRGSPAEANRRGPSVVPPGARDDLTRVGANFDEVQEAARHPDESSDEEAEAGDIAVV
ncbi:hypothetical protein M3Y99_00533700 [Aphelenchoides fujianensis]|nr:hypothetical protein M3Y99_00533700 [Aphelenchoides fujianensis]